MQKTLGLKGETQSFLSIVVILILTKKGWEKSPDDYIDNNGKIVFLHDDSWKNDVL